MNEEGRHSMIQKMNGVSDEDGRGEMRREVTRTYEDLVERIDRFLAEEVGNDVRRGTQLKVKESLQVIAKALSDYRYRNSSSLFPAVY
jgi:hypothetical protein